MCNVNLDHPAGAGHARELFARIPHRGHGPLLQQNAGASMRGFTLLEVLVALVVLAVALVALTRTASNETENFDALRQRSLAGWVAANTLTDLRLQPGLPATGRNEGSTRMAGRQWRWRTEVKATPSPGIRRFYVSVYEPGDDPAQGATPVWVMQGFDGDQLEP